MVCNYSEGLIRCSIKIASSVFLLCASKPNRLKISFFIICKSNYRWPSSHNRISHFQNNQKENLNDLTSKQSGIQNWKKQAFENNKSLPRTQVILISSLTAINPGRDQCHVGMAGPIRFVFIRFLFVFFVVVRCVSAYFIIYFSFQTSSFCPNIFSILKCPRWTSASLFFTLFSLLFSSLSIPPLIHILLV